MKNIIFALILLLVVTLASCLPPPDSFDDTEPMIFELPVNGVFASGDDGNVPENVLDNNLSTRWSSKGDSEWISFQLNDTYEVQSINISWYLGNERIAYFDVLYSEDNNSWVNAFLGESSGNTDTSENYDLLDAAAKYIRIIGKGNNLSNWNSITTVTIIGKNVDENTFHLNYSNKSQTYPGNQTPLPIFSDGKTVDAPITSSNLRIVVVAQDGSGQYKNIQDALNAAQPGDTIQIKNGIYVESLRIHKNGTREHPITLTAFSGHTPVVSPGNDKYPPDSSFIVRLDASWIIIENIEFRYGRDGIRVNKGYNTIRNNWIHHNQYMGIMNAFYGVNNLLIESNVIEYNGIEECWFEGVLSPRHCHQIYFSKARECDVPMARIIVRNNILSHSGGAGIQWNGQNCPSGFEEFIVEHNQFIDSARAFTLYHNVRKLTIRNNEVIFNQHPNTNAVPKAIIMLWGNSTGNSFVNNTFQSNVSDMLAIDATGDYGSQNYFDYNKWNILSDRWRWESVSRGDFRSSYKSVTGWDKNGEVI